MSSSVGDYEVFLSFRGADTRQGFTDVLYEHMSHAKIRVFRDDNALRIGDKIDSIFEGIVNSKICIPIFSPNFVQSKYCMLEVTKMVELKKIIVPIFYNVTSDDVKLKTSLYVDDFQKLEDKYGSHQVDEWKQALKEAVSYKGRKVGVIGYSQFCKEFVVEILSKLRPGEVEIHHSDGEANYDDMGLSSSTQEAVFVGINGTVGTGKIGTFGSAPVSVLGQEFVSPNSINLVFRRTGTLSMDITDSNDTNIIFKTNGHLLPLSNELLDASGNTLVTFKNKAFFTKYYNWRVFRGKSTDKKDLLFCIECPYRVQELPMKTTVEFYVYLGQSPNEDVWDYRVECNFPGKTGVIYVGNTNNMVAQITKATVQLSARVREDRFGLTVYPNMDYAFIVSLVSLLPALFGY